MSALCPLQLLRIQVAEWRERAVITSVRGALPWSIHVAREVEGLGNGKQDKWNVATCAYGTG